MTQKEKDISEYFKSQRISMKKPKSLVKLTLPSDEPLLFNSKFESGNLEQVYKINEYEYSLYLQQDTHNDNYWTQWFYFSTRNWSKGQKIVFTIKNLVKDNSLFNEGMKPCIFSAKKYLKSGTKWFRGCSDVWYYKNGECAQVNKMRETDHEFFKHKE